MKSNTDGLRKAEVESPALRPGPLVAAYNLALDVVFPRRCAGCRAWCDDLFCAACCDTLCCLAPPLCMRCGLPLKAANRDREGVDAESPDATMSDMTLSGARILGARSVSRTKATGAPSLCAPCLHQRRNGAPSFDVARSPFEFEGALRTAVHRFKYEGKTALARPLAALLEEFLRATPRDDAHLSTHVPEMMKSADLIVPVPLHAWRRFRRGYNQSELLARELGARLKVPVCDGLRRTRYTTPQVGLSARERQGNVRDAFELRSRHSGMVDSQVTSAKTILLIDDVCTTGATLHECARVLKQAATARVCALTLARQP